MNKCYSVVVFFISAAYGGEIWKNTPICFASTADNLEKDNMLIVSNCATGGVEAIDLITKTHLNVKWLRDLKKASALNSDQSNVDLFCAGNPLQFTCSSVSGNGGKGIYRWKSYSCVNSIDYLIFGDYECGTDAPQGVGLIVSKNNSNVFLTASWDVGDPSLWLGDIRENKSQIQIVFRKPAVYADSIVFSGSKSDSGLSLNCNLFSDKEGTIDWCSNDFQFWRKRNQ